MHELNHLELDDIDVLNKSVMFIEHVMKRLYQQRSRSNIDSHNSQNNNKDETEENNNNFTSYLLSYLDYRLASRRSDLADTSFEAISEQKRISAESATQTPSTSAVLKKPKKRHMPCVHGIHDFTSALLYSVETQHTIGYGLRYITEECSFAIIFLMLQSCFGIFIQGLVAGVVFAKISRPNKRKRTIIFSHNAVVSERDGKLCFMFKIGNVRISQLSDARVKMLMIKSRRTSEGEFIPFQTYDMKVSNDWSGNDSVFFPWPKTVEHIIDERSPFYETCKR